MKDIQVPDEAFDRMDIKETQLPNETPDLKVSDKPLDEINKDFEAAIKKLGFKDVDNNADANAEKHFEVYIDDIKQTITHSTNYTIRRFDITTSEHTIRLVGIGSKNNEITSFSLRVAEEPYTKWLEGNDSTQIVMQTTTPAPVYYFTKHNAKGETKLIWDGPEATGITLTPHASADNGDTLA